MTASECRHEYEHPNEYSQSCVPRVPTRVVYWGKYVVEAALRFPSDRCMLHELMLKLRQLQKHVEDHEICKATFRSSCVAATPQLLSYRCRYRYKYRYWDAHIHFIAHPLCSAFVWELSVDFSTFSGMFLSFICLSLRLFLLLLLILFLPFSSFSISSISYYCLCLVLLKQSLQFCRLQWLLLCQCCCCCCFVFVAVCCLLLPLSSLHSAPFSAFHLNEISGDSTKQS